MVKNEGPKCRGLRKRNGRWMIDCQIKGVRIRECTGSSSFSTAKDILERRRTELARERHLGERPVPKTTLGELIETYLRRPDGNVCDETSVKSILRFFDGTRGAGSIHVEDVLAYREWRASQVKKGGGSISPRTINIEVSFLRSMFNFGIKANLVLSNPVAGLPMLREARRLRIPTKGEVFKLLEAARQGPGYLRPLLLLAVNTGARRSELLGLEWGHIRWQEGRLWIAKGKGSVDRYVPMNEAVVVALRSLPQTGQWVFPVKSVRTAYCTARQRAGLDASLTLHSLRHFCASQLAENGCDGFAIMQILGHVSLSMSARYIHVSEARTKAGVRALPDFAEDVDAPEADDVMSLERMAPQRHGAILGVAKAAI